MNTKAKLLGALAAFAVAALSASAQTAGFNDLVVGFKQTGATNDVMIDLGNVSNYSAAGTTYTIGNYSSVLTSTFGAGWSTSSDVLWGAAASFKDGNVVLPTANWVTSKWTSTTGTLGAANSTAWTAKAQTQLNSADVNIGKAYTGLGTYSVGVAETIATANASSWKSATTTGATAFGQYTASTFNNNMGNLAEGGFSASDLYKVGNSTAGGADGVTQFLGTFALYQDGTLTFTTFAAIPEPSTYAALLGVATLGVVAIRRRRQAAQEV